MTPVVLVHGGGFDRRCWDLLLPQLAGPSLAVDLPGRGRHPMQPEDVTFSACASTVAEDVDAAGFDEVVIVGHSLAGCSMPTIVERLGDRVRHAVFIACTVPEDGRSAFDTLDPEIQAYAAAQGETAEAASMTMDEGMARLVIGEDLDDAQFAWCVERLVPEAPGLTTEPVHVAPLQAVPSTWIRTLGDLIVAPDKQVRFAGNVGDCPIVDIDAGHMCMVGKPETTAALVNEIAQRSS
jgi:pimeloyl-ACP methyl ester carboxylesterase